MFQLAQVCPICIASIFHFWTKKQLMTNRACLTNNDFDIYGYVKNHVGGKKIGQFVLDPLFFKNLFDVCCYKSFEGFFFFSRQVYFKPVLVHFHLRVSVFNY